jgi:NAD(P)H-dependent FMN reductase
MLKLVIISGSTREERRSHAVAQTLYEKLKGREKVQVEMLDVKAYNFPLLDYTFRSHPNPSEGLKDFHEKLKAADGMLLVSPEYNNSFSGPLKNTMDYFYPEYEKMACGLVTVSAGKMGGINAAKHLQHYALTLKSILLPKILTTPQVDSLYDGDELKDQEYGQKMDTFIDEFVRFAQAIAQYRHDVRI